MKTRTTFILVVLLSLALMAAGTFLHARMGSALVTHWNAQGQPDGTSSTFTAIYFLPLMLLGTTLFILALPLIDPLRKNIETFRGTLNTFVLVMAVFMAYLYGLTLAWNLGYHFNMNQMLVPAMGLLFYFVGDLLKHAHRNWFIGIRTPWTLSSDTVWDKTHQRGAVLFKAAGLTALLGIFFPNLSIFFLLVPVLCVSLYTLIYSYVLYQKEARA